MKAQEQQQGKFEMIDIENLIIPSHDEEVEIVSFKEDELFQRNKVSKEKVRERASNWNWLLCGALTVAKVNGVYAVLDGGNRLRSARLRGDIKKMPCMFYGELSVPRASEMFLELQNIVRVGKIQQHISALISKNPLAQTVDRIVTDHGYRITVSGGEFSFDAVAALYSLAKSDSEIANSAFRVCSDICNGERIYKEILFGVYELESRAQKQLRRTAFNDFAMKKLIKIGHYRILAKINEFRVRFGNSGGSQSRIIPARAINELVNKRIGDLGSCRLTVSFD